MRCSKAPPPFSSEVWGPLNKVGDQQGLKRHDDGRVTTPKGFVEAYAKFVESAGTACVRPAFGGQGCQAGRHRGDGDVERVEHGVLDGAASDPGRDRGGRVRGSDAQKQRYPHKMVSGSGPAR